MSKPRVNITADDPWRNRDWLYNEYIVKDRSSQEIADECGVARSTIQQWMGAYGIKKEYVTRVHKPKFRYQDKDYLYESNIVQHKTMSEIARENNVSPDTIRRYLKRYGFEPWKETNHSCYSDNDDQKFYDMYVNQKMSAYQIEMMTGVGHSIVIRHLRKMGVETRGISDAQFNQYGKELPADLENADLMRKMHWEDGISCKDLGAMYGLDPGTVRRHLNSMGVPTKNGAESKVGVMVGSRHPNWKGGITELGRLLREFFRVNLAPIVAKRDNYTCQLCGAQHVVLHVHHITPFNEIVGAICAEHPDLSPSDANDKRTLYDIITHDKRFLDTDNLITFCRECHRYEIHEYKRKTISSQAAENAEGSETI